MFERYSEDARRAIFFARYEASHLGNGLIEPEHLLLALLREGTGVAYRFVRYSLATAEGIRSDIEGKSSRVEKVSTSVDLPLSLACRRVLAFASEEAERLVSERIETAHLLLGILRVEDSFAAELLRERGLALDLVREEVRTSGHTVPPGRPAPLSGLERWLAARETAASAWTIERHTVGNGKTYIALYAPSELGEKQGNQEEGPAKRSAEIRKQIDLIDREMNHSIAQHEFERARSYSEEARKLREELRQLQRQFGLNVPPPPIPFLCIEVIANDRFSELQKRCDGYIAQGVAEVWLLDPTLQRAYTVTKLEGLREYKGDVLLTAGAAFAMDLKEVFD